MSDTAPQGPDDVILLIGIGDTHGDFAPLFEVVQREPTAQAVLQVGDLTAGKPVRDARQDDDPNTLRSLPIPLVWVHGNHEHWEWLGLTEPGEGEADRHMTPLETPGHHLWPGTDFVVPGTQIRVVGLPGNYAPTWYDRDKPFPGDRARHFNAADVAAMSRLREPTVLLMHEAFRGQVPGRIGMMGIPVLARLVRELAPRLCLTGHHHSLASSERGSTLAIALPRANQGYARLYFTRTGERVAWEFVPFDDAPEDEEP